MMFGIEEIGDEGLCFSFVLKKDQLEIDQVGLSVNVDITVNGSLNRIDDDVYLKGTIKTSVVASCSRCLDTLSCPIDSGLKAHFVPSDDRFTAVRDVELHASDIDAEVYENQQIDLTQSISDSILLAVPVITLCKDNCKGICFQCGNNLNQGLCKCDIESFADPRLERLKIFKDKFIKGG
ncbi:MAG: DUF177 domain-containing protein [Nitrospina sp.]|nr:DUF177 domain-containing protein [Nitrospina sp.]